MKRIITKIGICFFTLVLLLGTVPLNSVQAIDDDTSTVTEETFLNLLGILVRRLDGDVTNETTEQDIIDNANEIFKGTAFSDFEIFGFYIEEATEDKIGLVHFNIKESNGTYSYWRDIIIPRLPKEGEVVINRSNFPDDEFRYYIIGTYNDDLDYVLSVSEIAKINKIDFSENEYIKSLKGIEYFTALTYLSCYKTNVKELDVSNNTALTSLSCSNTGIKDLDISNNTALISLSCSNTGIKDLDISNHTALEYLYCYNSGIEELDISSNTALKNINCGGTKIDTLDTGKNTNLEILYCWDTEISNLDLSTNKNLTMLSCWDTNIESLDVSNNPLLELLVCYNTNITELDVSNNTALKNLRCGGNSLAWLNIENNANLIELDKSNSIISIEVTGKTFNLKDKFKNIDLQKVTILSNGHLDKETGVVSKYEADKPIVYSYDCGTSGNGQELLEVTLNLDIKKQDSTVTVNKNLNKVYDGNAVSLTDNDITVTGSANTVTYVWQMFNGSEWETVSSMPKDAGKYRVKVSVAEDGFYDSVETVHEFSISQTANSWIEVLDIKGWTYGEKINNPTAKTKYGKVIFTYSDAKDGTYTSKVPDTAGTWYVKAQVAETDNYAGIEMYKEFKIKKAETTISIIKDLDKVYDGKAVVLSSDDLDIAGSTGKISFKWEMYNGSSWEAVASAPGNAGRYRVTAHVEANENYESGTSAAKEFTIAKAETAISIIKDLDKVYDGKAAVLSNDNLDIVGSNGKISFKWEMFNGSDWEVIGSAPVNAGKYRVTAYVEANENYESGTSEAKEFTIAKAETAISIIKDLDKVYDGKAVVLSSDDLDIAGSNGKISFKWEMFNGSDWEVIGSAPVNAGKYRVTAYIEANENYESVTSVAKEFTVAKAKTTISIIKDLDKVYDGKAVVLSNDDLDIVGSTGKISFKWEMYNGSSWEVIASAPGNAGRYRVTAYVAEDENYLLGNSDVKEFIIKEEPKDQSVAIKTGDSNEILLTASLLILSLGVLITISKRKLNKLNK